MLAPKITTGLFINLINLNSKITNHKGKIDEVFSLIKKVPLPKPYLTIKANKKTSLQIFLFQIVVKITNKKKSKLLGYWQDI